MNNNLSEKKAWLTPTIEEAPVQITEGGFFDFVVETRFLLNDSDKPSSGS